MEKVTVLKRKKACWNANIEVVLACVEIAAQRDYHTSGVHFKPFVTWQEDVEQRPLGERYYDLFADALRDYEERG